MKKFFTAFLAAAVFMQSAAFATVSDERFDAVGNKLSSLEELITQCENMDLDVGYEKLNYEIISDFVKYGKVDITMGDTDRAEYVAEKIESLYTETENTLKAYINGSKSPKPVVRTATDDNIKISGGNLVNSDGEPVLLNGYGHFEQAKSDLERFQTFGANFIAMEIGPNDVVANKTDSMIDGWTVLGTADGTVDVVSIKQGNKTTNTLKLVNNTPAADNVYKAVRRTVWVKPNTTYTLSFYAKGTGVGTMHYMLSGWNSTRHAMQVGTGRTKNTATYTTGDGQYSMELILTSESPTTELYLDDFVLTEAGSTDNYLYNGDFEIEPLTSEHFVAYGSQLYNKIGRWLKVAEKENVRADVLISPHYMGDYLKSVYPEMYAVNSGLGFDMYNDLVREYYELYIKAVVNIVGGSSALNGICLVNEPILSTKDIGVDDMFVSWLKKQYDNDITKLNAAYGKTYTSFDTLTIPQSNTKDGLYRDWIMFNDEYYNDFFSFLAECVDKYSDNKIPVHEKVVGIFTHDNGMDFGSDPELVAEYCDYNGHDSYCFFGENSAYSMETKSMTYEYLKSVSNKPIINSEDHIIIDKDTNYSDKVAYQVSADVWQGAVHGRDMSALWLWERTTDKTGLSYGNIRYRPDALAKVGKAHLDMNRMSAEIAALQEATPKATVLFSKSAALFEKSHLKLSNTFFGAMTAGCNPDFITERQLENGKMPKSKIVLVANAKQLSDKAREALEKFKQRGGKVIAVGSGCLSANEYNVPYTESFSFDATLQDSISAVCSYLAENGGDALTTANGQLIENVDIKTAYCDDCYLMNLCNVSWEDGTKYATINGTATDLISGNTYTDTVPLSPLTPVLLSFKTDGDVSAAAEKTACGVKLTLKNSMACASEVNVSLKIRDLTTGKYVHGVTLKEKINADKTKEFFYNGIDNQSYEIELDGTYTDISENVKTIRK